MKGKGILAKWPVCVGLAVGMLLGTAAVPDETSGEAPRHDRSYYEARGDVIWEVPGDDKAIALTFDDGPDPSVTPRIVDLLKQYGAKATFFEIGSKVKQHPEIARRQAAEGHELANHTYTHRHLAPSRSMEAIRAEMAETQRTIQAASGQKPRLFRPPGGAFDDDVLEAAKREHLLTVMWSWHQDTKDWTRPGASRIARKVLRNARGGDIVLMHDYVSGSTQTLEALKTILPELRERGFRFVTVSELLNRERIAW